MLFMVRAAKAVPLEAALKLPMVISLGINPTPVDEQAVDVIVQWADHVSHVPNLLPAEIDFDSAEHVVVEGLQNWPHDICILQIKNSPKKFSFGNWQYGRKSADTDHGFAHILHHVWI